MALPAVSSTAWLSQDMMAGFYAFSLIQVNSASIRPPNLSKRPIVLAILQQSFDTWQTGDNLRNEEFWCPALTASFAQE
jgi:hypothetical protein